MGIKIHFIRSSIHFEITLMDYIGNRNVMNAISHIFQLAVVNEENQQHQQKAFTWQPFPFDR